MGEQSGGKVEGNVGFRGKEMWLSVIRKMFYGATLKLGLSLGFFPPHKFFVERLKKSFPFFYPVLYVKFAEYCASFTSPYFMHEYRNKMKYENNLTKN